MHDADPDLGRDHLTTLRVEAERGTRDSNAGTSRRLRGGRIARTVLMAAAVAVGVNVALAARDELRGRVLGDRKPASTLDQFHQSYRPVTRAEYEELKGLVMVPAVKRIGNLEDSDMKAAYELKPFETARVIVDDHRVGRVIAVSSANGEVCQLYTSPNWTRAEHGWCNDQFPPTGLLMSMGYIRAQTATSNGFFTLSGLAADDVTAIRVIRDDQPSDEVTLVGNAFRWESTDLDHPPVRVVVTRAGNEFSEELRMPGAPM
ncbi:MAG: hypothetical protein JWM25_622 [Thermoleophilia bacterium]|nr:hypothetical protein [Thermoleophilia bacterium]